MTKNLRDRAFITKIHYANVIVMTGAQLLTALRDELLILLHSLHTVKLEQPEFKPRSTA